jgi:hypothetical protein
VPAKDETQKRHMRSDQRHRDQDRHPDMSPVWVHGLRRPYREHEVEAADANLSALDTLEVGRLEQCPDVTGGDVSMTVEVRQKA